MGACAVPAPIQPRVSHQPNSTYTRSATCQWHQHSRIKATPQGLPLPHSYNSKLRSHPLGSCRPAGQRGGAVAQAAPTSIAGGGRAEESRRWGWQRWGTLGGGACFSWPEHTLQHHPRLPPLLGLGLRLGLLAPSVPGGLALAPQGGFFQIQVGGRGREVRHDGGGGGECAPLRRFPRVGQGGGHPSMSQLKRWCFTSMSCTPSFSGFFSFSCRTTQRAGSGHRAQQRGGALCGESPSALRSCCTSHLRAAETGRGPAVWRALGKGEACPSCAGTGSTLCQHCHTAPAHSMPWQGKQPHPQPPALAQEEAEDGLEHKAGRGRQ